MAQNVVTFSGDPTGIQLLDTLLTGLQANSLTSNSGTARPSYAQSGTIWLDITTTPWLLKVFNGTSDIVLGAISTEFALNALAANSIVCNPTASVANSSTLALGINKFPARASSGDLTAKTVTDFALTLLDDIDQAAARTTLGIDAAGNGRLIGYQIFTSSGTYSKGTNNPSYVIAEVMGGGGGGSGCGSGTYTAGGGGGGGGYSRKKILNASLAASESITIGAGGAAGANGGTQAGTGGSSSFGSHCSASGGTGGAAYFSGNGSNCGMTDQGVGGSGTGGDINLPGGLGCAGIILFTKAVGGAGGSGFNGCGGGASASAGKPNTGGGGGGRATPAGVGTLGGSGLIIVWEYA